MDIRRNISMILVVILAFHANNIGLVKIEIDMGNGKALRFYKLFDYCSDPKQYTVTYSDLKINLTNGVNYIDLNCTVKKPLSLNLKTSISVQRCTSMESPDTCIKMRTMNTKKYCDLIRDNTSFFSPMVKCWTPHPICPVKKTVFFGKGCSIDMAKFNWFPLGNYFWTAEVKLIDLRTKEMLTCIEFAAQIVRKT